MLKKPVIYLLLGIGLLAFCLGIFLSRQQASSITYNDFLSLVEENKVEKVVFDQQPNVLVVKVAGENRNFKIPNPNTESLFDFLIAHDVPISYQDNSNGSLFAQILLMAGIIGGVVFFRQKQSGGGLIKDANRKDSTEISLMLQDVAGNEEAKAMVADVIQFIKTPEKYNKIGAKMPRGILFYGPPGTGKTLMAKAVAGEAGVPFYPMSGSDFVQMYVGVGASRVRDLFKTAKKAEKAVIFIDEIDAIGKKRGKQPNGGNDERDQTLNALLTEMSGFHERDGIIVIAATNRLDTLDEALTRPGRFDRMVEIGLPDINARRKILELHSDSKQISHEVDLSAVAKSTVSFSGAMLENLLNEAAIFAANDGVEEIGNRHIDKAFYTVIAGAEKADTSYITPVDRKVTAYHEAGHALATRLLLPDSYISKVTIIPSVQGAGGFSLSIPKDSMYLSRKSMLANIKVLLAGRASEELIFGTDNITTGASNDIEKASRLMVDYVNKYGMDQEFGIFNTNVIDAPSEGQMLEICRANLKELYLETKRVLGENLVRLQGIADGLFERETLNGEEVEDIFSLSA